VTYNAKNNCYYKIFITIEISSFDPAFQTSPLEKSTIYSEPKKGINPEGGKLKKQIKEKSKPKSSEDSSDPRE